MFCPKCGNANEPDGKFCQSCGCSLEQKIENNKSAPTAGNKCDSRSQGEKTTPYAMISQKDKGTLILLACFGNFGLDRFYRGQTGLGIAKLLTMGGCGIWSLVDLFTYALGGLVQDSDGKWIVDKKSIYFIRNE
jgi:TM2 domain-containing membrane protein YozV